MNQFTATAPNGQILVRNTKNHTYNHAVLVLQTAETLQNIYLSYIASNERQIAECADRPGNEAYVARLIKENAKYTKALATCTDSWGDASWRRDLASAHQEASRIQDLINRGHHSASAVIVVPTTQTK